MEIVGAAADDRQRGHGAVAGAPPRRDHLERAVLDVLWDHPEGAPASQVLASLGGRDGRDLATTTVLTVLERLRRKGLVQRRRIGRSYHHRATSTREDLVATTMLAALGEGADRPSALARFVAAAGDDDLRVMREVLLPGAGSGQGASGQEASGEVAPVCGPQGPAAGSPGGAGCGGAGGSCGCCTCGPGCACCQSPAVAV